MSEYMEQLTDEAQAIITNINQAARNMLITAQQRDELIKIVLNDVADSAGLATAQALLYAWS